MAGPDFPILAIAVRGRRLGFAVLVPPCTLIDWGMSFFTPKNTGKMRAARRRIESLFVYYTPGSIAVAASDIAATRNAPAVRSLVRVIQSIAAARSIRISSMTRDRVRSVFSEFHARSKEEIAAIIAARFPELRWRLPPIRKKWEREHTRMVLFDAVAAGFAYWKEMSNPLAERTRARQLCPPVGPSVTYRRMIRPPRREGSMGGRNFAN